jgi:ATP-dependent exoDNAse (exonuclease V) alpha subunit
MRDALNKAEIEAIEQFQQEQAQAAQQEQEKDRSIEDVYLDAFTAYTEGEKTPPHIMEAFAAIAAFFYDDDPEFKIDGGIDGVTGDVIEGSDPNNCQFNQKGILGNFCQQADWMLGREERRLNYLKNAAFRARRAHSQSEIDTLALEKAEAEYGKCKLVNLPILEDFKKAAKTAYLVQFGEEWVRPTKKDTARTTEQLEDRFKHQERRSRL